ncbi:MAG: hypothetical protein Q9204_002621 [Flavoplaca sp. TL-2023a]
MRTSSTGTKRARTDDSSLHEPGTSAAPALSDFPSSSSSLTANTVSSTTFRNVSACHRCARCVGFDPITKREIPRTYVYYLESRLKYLETLLTDNGVAFASTLDFNLGAQPIPGPFQAQTSSSRQATHTTMSPQDTALGLEDLDSPRGASGRQDDDEDKLNNLVSNISMASVRGSTNHPYLGTTSGLSFARIVFAAVKNSVANASPEKSYSKTTKPAASARGNSMRESFFGLHSTPSVKPAPFPDRALGLQLATIYFSFSNPQLPVLHKGEFMSMFEGAYASTASHRSARELYMLNIVFAIGAGIFLEDSHLGPRSDPGSIPSTSRESDSPHSGKRGTIIRHHRAEEYHAAAMMHLESFPTSNSVMECPNCSDCGLEELQSVLLLAGFALLRPVSPGLWYIVGVATRMGVDLGLHHEEGTNLDENDNFKRQDQNQGPDSKPGGSDDPVSQQPEAEERGRREWMRDLRRRLWWCVYSFDRLVSTCVGRPFGITDQVITTDFPALLNDEQITRSGFTVPVATFTGPSYKRVSHHYFRLRLLQSEILQVLQYRHARQVRTNSSDIENQYMHTRLSSSFLQPFESFRTWRQDIARRLWEWKNSAPLQDDTTVDFDVRFLELNYWQMIMMLYRQSLGVESQQPGRGMGPDDVFRSVSMDKNEDTDDEEVHLKIAEAGQRVLVLYRQLHRIHLVNYTYLATVHLFMAGIAFLYVLWHSTTVRSRMTLDDVDFTILAATSVLGDLSAKCPPAEACRDAFERMSKATVKMCLSTTGFGSPITASKGKYSHRQYRDSPAANGATALFEQHERPRPSLQNYSKVRRFANNESQDDEGPESRDWERQANHERIESLQSTALLSPPHDDESELTTAGSWAVQSPQAGDPFAMDLDKFRTSRDRISEIESDLLLTDADSMSYDTGFGTNLGFGIEHDWSDGLQLDLFDGFFFGGNMGNSV